MTELLLIAVNIFFIVYYISEKITNVSVSLPISTYKDESIIMVTLVLSSVAVSKTLFCLVKQMRA